MEWCQWYFMCESFEIDGWISKRAVGLYKKVQKNVNFFKRNAYYFTKFFFLEFIHSDKLCFYN